MTTLYLGIIFRQDELDIIDIEDYDDLFPSYCGKTPQQCLDRMLTDELFADKNILKQTTLKKEKDETWWCEITSNYYDTPIDYMIVIKPYTA